MLEAKPPPKAASQTPCAGVETLIGNERRCLKPGSGKTEWFKDCAQCPEMVVVPAGTFTMGSPPDEPEREHLPGSENQVSVTIAQPFAVGRFAVTRGEFAAFVSATSQTIPGGCNYSKDKDWRSVGFPQTDHHPVVCVSWHDAKAYAEWLSSTTGQSYRLLSEAEREYVTRAGTTTAYWWGSTISPAQANYLDKGRPSSDAKRNGTVPVESFEANPWGLYNVHGNVHDWTEDCGPILRDARARTVENCDRRVIRGGAWAETPRSLRSANRNATPANSRFNQYGLRVARTLN
jgi:formylglycine-generating enzyme required for sulfatase activity